MAIPSNIHVEIGRAEKPPIGVAPHWAVYQTRIMMLAEAIMRYADFAMEHRLTRDTSEDYKQIARWATEIARLAELEAEMECR